MSTTHINDMGQRLLSPTVAKGKRQLQESLTGVDGKGPQLLCQRREKTNQRDTTSVHALVNDSCQRPLLNDMR